MAILNNSNAISTAGGYDVNNSLRFRLSASAYLNRTPASAGNRKTFTWSAWVKRGALNGGGTDMCLFNAGTTSPTYDGFRIKSDTISFFQAGAASVNIESTQVFRDPSAWYHLVLAVDTTQATAANRVKIYVNGSQITAFGTANYPALNAEASINNNLVHNIAAQYANTSSSSFFDGYMTEINFIDGQALTPSSFGETDTTTGVWKPKAYTGTFGTNGFYLKFSDIATTSGSNAGLGKDFSGNANYWTTNNISVTAGTTYDAMIDSPTLTSATVANYAVLNPLNSVTQATLADGNLNASSTTAAWKTGISTIQLPTSGKWYFETTIGSGGVGNGVEIGLVSYDQATYRTYKSTGTKNSNTGGVVTYGASYTSSDIIGTAIDIDAGTIVFYKNNSSQGTAFSDIASAVPSSGWYLAIQANNSSNHAANFGQRPFSYTPPTGFVRLNTYNLPDSTIKKGNTVMDATLWTGNGTTQTITNAGAFKPDLVWVKSRSNTFNNNLFNSISGVNKFLVSDTTAAEASVTGTLTAFNSNGFSVGSDIGLNFNGGTYVGWQWQAGQGTTSSNTSGSITSTVSVNTTAGFSIVTYTGNGSSGATFGHGLGVAPKMVIVKIRNTTDNWRVGHAFINNGSSPWNYNLTLNQTNAQQLNSTVWNNTAPTSTLVTLGNDSSVNASSSTYVAYCWAAIAGYSAFGSYTGNGSTDGPFVFTNFRPKWIMIKRTDADSGTYAWLIYDAVRNTYNYVTNQLFANISNAEGTGTTPFMFLSNGFKITNTGSEYNASGGTFIYACFASNPFKNSNAV